MMRNLVDNALKYTPAAGQVDVGAAPGAEGVRLWVRDTGCGIAPEDHVKVFEAFRQTETGLRKAGGTGLGLPISKRLAEAHGGHLWLESEIGRGSVFSVKLPIKSAALFPTITD